MTSEIDNLLTQIVDARLSIERNLWTIVEEAASILGQISPAHRKPFIDKVRIELLEHQNYRCGICNELIQSEQFHIDHIIPFDYGGRNERTNVRVAHPICNQQRGTQVELLPLLRYLEDRAMNLPPAERLAFGISLD